MRYVVIGGGVAGVCCAEELARWCAQPEPAAASETQPARPPDEVVLVSSSSILKGVTNIVRHTRNLEEFLVVETSLQELQQRHAGHLKVLTAYVQGVDTDSKVLHLGDGGTLQYDKLCITVGAVPRTLQCEGGNDPRVVTVRDNESVEELAARLRRCRRLMVVGNGGIALELVGTVAAHGGPELVWVLKHGHIGDSFFDVDAAQFLLHRVPHRPEQQQQQQGTTGDGAARTEGASLPGSGSEGIQQDGVGAKGGAQLPAAIAPASSDGAAAKQSAVAAEQATHAAAGGAGASSCSTDADNAAAAWQQQQSTQRALGHAAGPKWTDALRAKSQGPGAAIPGHAQVSLEFEAHVARISRACAAGAAHEDVARPSSSGAAGCSGGGAAHASAAASSSEDTDGSWPLYVTLSNGKVVGVDLVVCAIGVEPNTAWLPATLQRAADGGLAVNPQLRSSAPDVYAAGDCCTTDVSSMPPHWFQMRLWTQARLMGLYAAHCMAGVADTLGSSFSFELFTHVTHFLGLKVVLLGLYNGQRLESEPEHDMVLYSRVMEHGPSPSFVRVLLLRGRMQGAVLIGETDLEETFENLILDGLDLSQYGADILDPDIELDHMFD